jgi:hypothetical protein
MMAPQTTLSVSELHLQCLRLAVEWGSVPVSRGQGGMQTRAPEDILAAALLFLEFIMATTENSDA